MRIQIYAGNFHPEPTGTGKYTGEMAAWLARAGHEVEVICGFPYYPEWRLAAPYQRRRYLTERWQGVTIHRVPHYIPANGRVTTRRRLWLDMTLFLAMAPWALRTLFARRSPDVMMAVCPSMLSGFWPLLVARLRRRPWVFHVQDLQLDAAERLAMLKGRRLIGVLRKLESGLFRRATRVSSITPAMCRAVMQRGVSPARVFELPNWSRVDQIVPRDRDTDFRRELGVAADDLLVMYAGAMGRKQGLELILDAAQQLRDDARFHFVMIGAGADAEALRAQGRERELANLRFMPVQPEARLGEVLASADIHLVIQKSNAADLVMPSKLTNILAAGRAVIATADPGTALWDAVAGERTGLAVPPEDGAALVAALRRFADEPGLRAACAAAGRRYAEANLDAEHILGDLNRRLETLVAKPHAASAALL